MGERLLIKTRATGPTTIDSKLLPWPEIDPPELLAEAQVVECPKCGEFYEIGDWPLCNGDPANHVPPQGSFRRGNAQSFSPVVVFRGKGGMISVPGDNRDPTPHGYERVEIDSVRGVRKLQKTLDLQSRIEREGVDEREERAIAQDRKIRRANLTAKMSSMSEQGRAFAKLAMRQTDAKPKKRYNPGNYIESFEYDKSNRLPHNSERTDWKDKN